MTGFHPFRRAARPAVHRLIIHAKITWHFGPRLLADWDEAGAVTVHELTRGPWEDDLLASLLPPLLPPAKPHEVQNG